MHSAADWSGTLVSWSVVFLFHVLPIAVSQIYDWVREWQVLVAVLVALAFFYVWSRTILRAARRTAKETIQTEARAFEAGLKLLQRQIGRIEPTVEAAPMSFRPAAPLLARQQPPSKPLPQPPPPEQPPAQQQPPQQQKSQDSHAAVEHLRQAIRLALGKIPLNDEPLPPDGVRLYRTVIDAGTGPDFPVDDPTGALKPVLAELAALERSFPPQSCRQAWQSLVKLNALAREIHEPGEKRAEASSAQTNATGAIH
jgi:hypothetical protein